MRTPALRHFSTTSRCQSTLEPVARPPAAMVGPTPSAAASSSSVAAMIRSIERKSRASACAAVGPDVPDRQRDEHPPQRDVLAGLQVGQQLRAVGGEGAVLLREERRPLQLLLVEEEDVALVLRAARSAAARSPPRSRGSRCRRRRGRRRGRPAPAAARGRTARSGSGCRRRPPSPGRSSVPHSGQWVGMTNSRSEPSRAATTGPSTSGMTSPALRMTTVSPISTPLRLTSQALCSVASCTVEPATFTGSM